MVLIDGTPIPTQRRAERADRRNYSGTRRSHGPHFLALTNGRGRLIWISAARPGRTHDITARHDHVLAHLRAAGLGRWRTSASAAWTTTYAIPVSVTGLTATRAHKLRPGQKDADRVLATRHAPVEHSFAHPGNWRTLTKLRADPARDTHLLRALLVLTNLDVDR
ncbi:transposase family protein [Streptomyces sp. NPDC020801]|uniref:transposase family protein n=1 Tax=unclassified Streptomyces TaxID=2593676 RepID=UPI0037A7E840